MAFTRQGAYSPLRITQRSTDFFIRFKISFRTASVILNGLQNCLEFLNSLEHPRIVQNEVEAPIKKLDVCRANLRMSHFLSHEHPSILYKADWRAFPRSEEPVARLPSISRCSGCLDWKSLCKLVWWSHRKFNIHLFCDSLLTDFWIHTSISQSILIFLTKLSDAISEKHTYAKLDFLHWWYSRQNTRINLKLSRISARNFSQTYST